MSDLTDTKLDVYKVGRLLGSGGMAEVYEAKHTLIGRRCALKVLHDVLQKNEEGLTRMIREAQAASAIGHPNIVDVFDFRRAPSGKYFMVMELLYGEPLSDILDEHEMLEIDFSLMVMGQVLSALNAAHKKGIIHRDMKPGNVFLAKSRGPGHLIKLLDFGISKFVTDTRENLRLTKTGMVLGTPYYMSPEQASGKMDVDARADLWACGVILYEMVTGLVPFDGENYNEVMVNIVTKDFEEPSLHREGLPPKIDEIVARAMTKERQDRYQTPEEMWADLEELLPDEPVKQGDYSLKPQPLVPEASEIERPASLPDISALQDLAPATRRPTRRERPGYPSTRVLWGAGQRPPGTETLEDTGKRGTASANKAQLSRGTLTEGENVGVDITSERNTLIPTEASKRPLVYAIGGGLLVAVVATALFIGLYVGRKTEPPSRPAQPSRATEPARTTPSAGIPDAAPKKVPVYRDAAQARKPRMRPRPDAGPPMINVTLRNLPKGVTIKINNKQVQQPIRLRKSHRKHCITISKPRFWPMHRCFRASKDITYKVKLWIKLKPRKGPRSIYDSPYGSGGKEKSPY